MPYPYLSARAVLCAAALALCCRASADAPASQPGTSAMDAPGDILVNRVVPIPATVSPEARERIAHPPPSILSSGAPISEQRARIDARQARDAAACLKVFPATVTEAVIAGIPVRIVDPQAGAHGTPGRVLINLHGGGFHTDTGSLLESIPVASLSGVRVVSVLYPLSPEHAFPQAVDAAVAVYRELLKTHAASRIAIYGTSAGAILTAETAVRLRQDGLPLPAALGIFSGSGDFSRAGDSAAFFGIQGLSSAPMPRSKAPMLPDYTGKTELTDPVLSPVYADLKGMPPALFLTSTRDMLLSGTVNLHRAFLAAGDDARLVVFDALPHAFWLDATLPESREADALIARFLAEQTSR